MKRVAVYFSLVLMAPAAWAQLREIPIQYRLPPAPSANSRLQGVTPVTLPFWDDFSTSTGRLDTAWWLPASQAQILARPGNGILPPTLNVVTFDGVDANGNPYSPTDTDGPTDSLVSRPIDLTQVPVSLRNTVYLSFFFQVKGQGNQPEPEDSLLLYFKKSDGRWQKMWPLAGDVIPQDPKVFTQKLVHVPNDTAFFHDHFQFKFQAFGRQNGWYDNWNIDYVYMDKRRHANDNSFLDRALVYPPKSILNGYTAVPFKEFVWNNEHAAFLTNSSTWIKNLENDVQPVKYSAIITDTLNDVVLETIANDQELVLFPNDIKEALSNVPNPAIFDLNADSLFLEIKYFVNTGDKNLVDSIYNAGADTAFYANINLRVNDTVRSYVTLHDYFAYDDGSAEYGAGINQRDGRIAYEFFSNSSLFIDRVDIYFPNISRNQAGSPMEIFVLQELRDIQNPYLALTTGSIQHTGINEFVSYYFSRSIQVKDTFYIGFRNLADDGLWTAIGLDKNTDSGDKIYYSVDGTWQQNTDIRGSLMIRPHFTTGFVTGINEEQRQLAIYPNPATDRIFIDGRYDRLTVVDITGRQVPYQHTATGPAQTQLRFTGGRQGLLLVIIEYNGQREVHKVVLNN